jgi:MFS family permease
VSLATDIASEMLYPVMPVYLESIGFSVLLIGVLEGIAEAIAGLSKGYFGKWSDHSARRVPFVQAGYTLSAISKPMLILFVYPLWVFFARTLDRFGKGIRTGARDAILAQESTPGTKAKIFGFHRSMDTLGAALGPVFALIYLYYNPGDYKTLFLIAVVPGLIAVITTLLLKEKHRQKTSSNATPGLFSFLKYWRQSPGEYRSLVSGLLVFALINSSDFFLLLKLKQDGVSDTLLITIYIFYNLVYALCAFPLGIVADKWGFKKMFVFGLMLFACVYLGMTLSSNLYVYFTLFFIYGVYASATEGTSKAWISTIVASKDTATAIGTFAGFQSICTLIASSFTGLIWSLYGAMAAFLFTGIGMIILIVYFLVGVSAPAHSR